MLPLIYPRLWLGVGVGLLVAGIVAALTSSSAVAVINVQDKVMHAAAFAFFMVWFCGIYSFRFAPAVASALLLYGILIELMQGLTPVRQPEIADVVADLIGILLGWIACAAGLRQWCTRIEAWLAPAKL